MASTTSVRSDQPLTPERRKQTRWVFWTAVAAAILLIGVPLVIVIFLMLF